MAHLIDKDALVAEIESLLDKGRYHEEYDCAYRDGNNSALYALKGKIDALEVKEVDLEKAIDDYIYTHDGRNRLALEPDWKYCNLTLKGGNEIIKFAKHFFELGMQVSNKAQKVE